MAYNGVPAVGTKVMIADGEELGRVKEISGDCFKVDAAMAPDYWLGADTIASGSDAGGAGYTGREATIHTVGLKWEKDRLDDMKRDGTSHQGYHRHIG